MFIRFKYNVTNWSDFDTQDDCRLDKTTRHCHSNKYLYIV